MSHAWIDGRPVALNVALSEAARSLATSRMPVVAGLGTDVAGARATIALAQRLGAAIDHMNSEAVLRDLSVMREAAMTVTTANEARLRADVLVLVGAGPADAGPELTQKLLAAPVPPRLEEGAVRRIIRLCPGSGPTKRAGIANAQVVGRSPGDLPAVLAALRARVADRPVGKTRVAATALDALVVDLRGAHFGVAVWSATELDALAIEMLCGLIDDLNAETRFAGLALAPDDNAIGVMQVCGWMTGFPMRTGFARGYAEHDPWRFDATRLVESGEGDCALWISAYRPAAPLWKRNVPTVALTAPGANFRHAPRVYIEVGCPGTDHDAVEHCPFTGTLVPVAATKPAGTISVADAIAHIATALPSAGASSC